MPDVPLRTLLSEASRRPPSFLLRKLRDLTASRLRGLAARAGLDPYRARVDARSSTAGIPVGIEAARSGLSGASPESLADLRRRAIDVMAGRWSVLSRPVDLRGAIDWMSDPASGRVWPTRFHAGFRYADLLDRERPSDVKHPWELSRLQFLPVLAAVARLDDDPRCARRARELLDAWVEANPPGYGINWTVGMEVAIRLVNVAWASELLAGTRHEGFLPASTVAEIGSSHGRFLFRNLEYSDIAGNHYSACLLGLLYASVFAAGDPESARWGRLARIELFEEALRQTYPDGACHEGSVPYHRLVLEIFLHARALLVATDGVVPPPFDARLERMLEFTAACTKPGGEVPVWGDADDGTILRLGSRGMNDHRYLLAAGGEIFDRADLAARAGDVSDVDAVCLTTGRERSGAARAAGGTEAPPSVGFGESGYYVLRAPGDYCFIDCADVGLRGRGGHGHNDALAVEVTLGGEDLFVDTGCPSYTRDVPQRLAALGVRAHTSIMIDGEEPAPLSAGRFPHATACPVEAVSWNPEVPAFRGRRLGDGRIAGVEHVEREVVLEGPATLRIVDRIEGAGRHHVEWSFHFDAGWTRLDGAAGIAVRRGAARASIASDLPADAVRWETTSLYRTYGVATDRLTARVSVDVGLPLRVEHVVRVWREDG